MITNPEKYPKYILTTLERYFKSDKKYVLVLREKHGTAFMDASSVEALAKSCLSVLKARSTGHYNWYGTLEDLKKPKEPEITKELYEALPEGTVKAEAKRVLESYLRKMRDYEEEVSFLTDIKRALDEQDGILAYMLLSDRGDHEYEGFSMEPIRTEYK